MRLDQQQIEQAILVKQQTLARLRTDGPAANRLRHEIKLQAERWRRGVCPAGDLWEADRYPRSLAEARLRLTALELDQLIDWELLPADDERADVSKAVVEALAEKGGLWWRGLLKLIP